MKSNSYELQLPEGTVTFLFTDIEGSTKMLKELGDQYGNLLTEHRRILREIFTCNNGQEVDVQGDMCFFTFPRASDAITAAVEAQRTLAEHDWSEEIEVCVRMGLHTGEPLVADGGYVGMDVHRASRIGDLGHGGQVLLSEATAGLIRNELPEDVSLLDLGEHRLKEIPHPEPIHQLVIEGLPSEFPPLKSLEAEFPPHNLPPQTTPFVGRVLELEALETMISDPEVRLISIVAAGGMGKTRLALASSEKQISITDRTNGKVDYRFPHGIYFVPLASLETPRSILPAIAEALNFQIMSSEGRGFGAGEETRSPKQQLFDYLRSKRLLLIMDNFEHLLEGADLVSEIMYSASEVKILITSRERLHLKGEQLFPLLGMRFPEEERLITSAEIDHKDYSALALFLQSAQRVQPDFKLTEEDLVEVVSICRLVGGMPLGIELAASWVNMLTLEKITKEIQGSLDFLETKLRDVDERHRSMRAVFDSTWNRLSHPERDLFEKLTVFQGGFTREAAQKVADASLDLLGDLTNRSLLQFDRTRGTYEIHELLRQFGAERLTQDLENERDVRDRHSAYYCELLSQLEPSLKGPQHVEAMDAIEAEIENITIAWNSAAEQGRVKWMINALEAMDVYYEYSGRWEEGEEALRYALEVLPASQTVDTLRLRVRLNTLEARFIPAKRMDVREKLIEKNWELLKSPILAQEDTRWEEAGLITLVGQMTKDSRESLKQCRKAYHLFKLLEDKWKMAILLDSIGGNAVNIADRNQASRVWEKSLTIFRELEFKRGVANQLNRLSVIAMFDNDLKKAGVYLQESMEISKEMDDRRTLGWTLLFLGFLRIYQGRFMDAYQIFNEGKNINEELGHTHALISSNVYIAVSENLLGRYQEAFARAVKTQKDAERENFEWLKALSLLEHGRALLGAGDFKNANDSLQTSIDIFRVYSDLIYLSLSLSYLGICMYGLGEYAAMKDIMQEVLQINSSTHRLRDQLEAFPAISLLQLAEGRIERAIEYYAYVSTYSSETDSQLTFDVVGRHIKSAAESLPSEVVAAAQERGRKLDPCEVIQELLFEMESK